VLGANPDFDGRAERLDVGQKLFDFRVTGHQSEIVIHVVSFAPAGVEIGGEIADFAPMANSSASKLV
jgi:hypothetical protein